MISSMWKFVRFNKIFAMILFACLLVHQNWPYLLSRCFNLYYWYLSIFFPSFGARATLGLGAEASMPSESYWSPVLPSKPSWCQFWFFSLWSDFNPSLPPHVGSIWERNVRNFVLLGQSLQRSVYPAAINRCCLRHRKRGNLAVFVLLLLLKIARFENWSLSYSLSVIASLKPWFS